MKASHSHDLVRRTAALVVAVLIGCVLAVLPDLRAHAAPNRACTGTGTGTEWIASWAASPSDALPLISPNLQPALVTGGQSFRMVITPHRGGLLIRVRLTNRFGTAPVTFAHVTAAVAGPAGSLSGPVPTVTFGGRRSVTVAAGRDVVSDPIQLSIKAFQPVAISYFVPRLNGRPTEHFNANQTSLYTDPNGRDLSGSRSGRAFVHRTTSWFWISGLDVEAPATHGSLVTFGDSITDGIVGLSPLPLPADTVQVDRDVRYPDFLQRRLTAAGIPLTAVNSGISGNQVLQAGLLPYYGPAAGDRIMRDVVNVPGVTHAIVLEGINDLGEPLSTVSLIQLKGAYIRLVRTLQANGIHVLLGTVMPSGRAILTGPITSPGLEQRRQQVNAWIRSQRIADGVVDFDKAMRSPTDATILNPAYASGDNLHPNPRGYRAMANAVPLHALTSGCRR